MGVFRFIVVLAALSCFGMSAIILLSEYLDALLFVPTYNTFSVFIVAFLLYIFVKNIYSFLLPVGFYHFLITIAFSTIFYVATFQAFLLDQAAIAVQVLVFGMASTVNDNINITGQAASLGIGELIVRGLRLGGSWTLTVACAVGGFLTDLFNIGEPKDYAEKAQAGSRVVYLMAASLAVFSGNLSRIFRRASKSE
ncbi:MAG: hypothetical protein ACX939_06100 [Hyphococcus sp.]